MPVLVDDIPLAEPGEEDFTEVAIGLVPCPECGEYFKSARGGLTRHRRSAHGIEPDGARSASKPTKSSTATLAVRWAEFQRGSALFVSFACSQCAAVLVEDAQHDAEAIALYCEKRPKLRKQIEQVLGGMDVMILVGALGETARKMLAHHSIGRQLGLPGSEKQHAAEHGAQEKMMSFLTNMDPDARHQLIDQVFTSRNGEAANSSVDVQTPVTVTVETNSDSVPGMPPNPNGPVTEQDRYAMAVAHSATGEWSST